MKFEAFTHDFNAGFATETILVLNGTIVRHKVTQIFNQASWVEGLRPLYGQPISAIDNEEEWDPIHDQKTLDIMIEDYNEMQIQAQYDQ